MIYFQEIRIILKKDQMASVLQGKVELGKAEVQELSEKARNFAILNGWYNYA